MKYEDKSLSSNSLFSILKKLDFLNGETLRDFWVKYTNAASNRGRVIGKPRLMNGEGEINVIGIRCNDEVSFNLGKDFYNDLLIIWKSGKLPRADMDEIYVYDVTLDPSRKKDGIAHLAEGVYDSYKIRNHAWTPGRTAICQDRNPVLVLRTDAKGNLKKPEPYKGLFGINIHDSSIYTNSSLGCTVLEKDSIENDFHYKNSYKPLLKSIANPNEISYLVANFSAIHSYLMHNLNVGAMVSKSFMGNSL